ncbi:MAG: hypothetical protein Q8K05_05655 [Polaromonas sp.]|uniref:hypothetical protein n=1 Tax=Polaromonas sp. TaxID=1869339 RepID=UPI00272FAC40|nr:hypothetical protein [Polaromonas sp.]MDP2255531.1 hypothetical protein [Polaromonas sp.]
MVGKPDVAQRLCGSLPVDIEKTRRLLGWTPPLSLDDGLRRAAGGGGDDPPEGASFLMASPEKALCDDKKD